MNKILPLWSVPRSISTAFERMMMERGDFTVYHEPFSYYYYLEAGGVSHGLDPDPAHPTTFEGTLDMITGAAKQKPVFFKDMSYYVIERADDDFIKQFVNSFIIRDPALTLVSYYKLHPEFTLREAGFESQFTMYERVKRLTGAEPAVVDAEDLIADAASVVKQYCERTGIEFLPESLSWGAVLPDEWKAWQMWHQEAADSTGFQRDAEQFEISVHDVPRLEEMYQQCMPYYEKLAQVRIRA
jgi:hypothetical protein